MGVTARATAMREESRDMFGKHQGVSVSHLSGTRDQGLGTGAPMRINA